MLEGDSFQLLIFTCGAQKKVGWGDIIGVTKHGFIVNILKLYSLM